MINNNAEKLEKLPLRKLFLVMAVPSVLAQLINVLYNIVDRIYIGHIKEVGSFSTYRGRCDISNNNGGFRF